jgi:hypothetical protein
MKKILSALLIILSILSVICLVARDSGEVETAPTPSEETLEAVGLWADAKYLASREIGKGSKTVTVTVVADGKSIALTVKTDKEDLGAALYELGIINDPTFFDTCNGILASWEKDQAYWGFKQDGKMLNYGVGDAKINGGESFSIEYTK